MELNLVEWIEHVLLRTLLHEIKKNKIKLRIQWCVCAVYNIHRKEHHHIFYNKRTDTLLVLIPYCVKRISHYLFLFNPYHRYHIDIIQNYCSFSTFFSFDFLPLVWAMAILPFYLCFWLMSDFCLESYYFEYFYAGQFHGIYKSAISISIIIHVFIWTLSVNIFWLLLLLLVLWWWFGIHRNGFDGR